MGLDIRWPIGVMFLVIGAVLAGFGAFGNRGIYARSLGLNVNLGWGLVMIAFGITLLWLARRASLRQAERNSHNHSQSC